MTDNSPASKTLTELNIPHLEHVHTTEITSLEQAAAERNQDPSQVVRSIVFRLSDDEYANDFPILCPAGRAVAKAYCDSYGTRNYESWRPVVHLVKAKCRSYIGDIPYWSCQEPRKAGTVFNACGKCKACREYQGFDHHSLDISDCTFTKEAEINHISDLKLIRKLNISRYAQ